MQHLGDISKINGAHIAPVDIITFGSPCQDLSVAGKQAGLEGSRSGLFREAVRIIKEMRDATNGKQPRFAIWENVPGAFSSNKGADFQTALHELCKITEPKAPAVAIPKAGWPPAGQFSDVGGGSLAYRTVDAQFHGVPQRRRRIILVCDFAGQCAGDILFKPRGLPGYPAQGVCEGQDASRAADDGTDHAVLCYTIDPYASNSMKSDNPYSGIHKTSVTRCLDTTSSSPSCNQGGNVIVVQGSMIGRADENGPNGAGLADGACFCLTATDRYAVVIENHPQDSRVKISPDGIVQTLASQMGTGG